MEWHLITGEYPPQPGGVSDYTKLVADELCTAGDEVHVWCPSNGEGQSAKSNGLSVHRQLGRISPADLRRVGKMLDAFPTPRRLLVQWVPHSFGMRTMNVPFCLWLWNRSRKGDVVEIMAHECFLPFKRWAWKQNMAALVQRLMTMILLRATRRVWVSIPAWEARWRPLAFGRRVTFTWLPVPSNIPVIDHPAEVRAVRQRYGINGDMVVGHFGTYNRYDRQMLTATLPLLIGSGTNPKVILMGRNSKSMLDELLRLRPDLSRAVRATGTLEAGELSSHLSACDVLLQPYQGGVSTRRTSVMASLLHGRPIVTTYGWQTDELWRGSGAVALAPEGNAQAVADETRRLLGNKNDRDRLAQSAYLLYQQRFDVRHLIRALRQQGT
jgi:glycosyltransferase involved in cell wall biosynthesis